MSQDSSERDLPRQAGDEPDDTHAEAPEYELSEQPTRAVQEDSPARGGSGFDPTPYLRQLRGRLPLGSARATRLDLSLQERGAAHRRAPRAQRGPPEAEAIGLREAKPFGLQPRRGLAFLSTGFQPRAGAASGSSASLQCARRPVFLAGVRGSLR